MNQSPATPPTPPTTPGPLLVSEKTFLGHPVGLFLLFMVEMWERFSFYGMRAILGLYLKCKISGMDPLPAGASPGFNPGRGWSAADASNLTGWYGGMAYLLPIAGGLIADKLIGTHRSMIVGGVLIAIGHLTLGISGIGALAHNEVGMSTFVMGLVLIIIGTGHFKPSVSVMVNQLYPDHDPRQEGAFSIFYMGINLGALLGVFLVGTVGERVGWHWGFTLAAVGMVAGLLMYSSLKKKHLGTIGNPPGTAANCGHCSADVTAHILNTPDLVACPRCGKERPAIRSQRSTGRHAPLFVLVGIVLSAIVAAGFHFGVLKRIDSFFSNEYVFYSIMGIGIAAAVLFTLSQRKDDRGPVASIFIFMLFNFLFWLAFEQAGTSLNFFADEKIDRATGLSQPFDLVPTTWFQNINSFTILLLTPVFAVMWTALARRRIPVPQPVKIGIGLVIVGLGFVTMVVAGRQVNAPGALASMWTLLVTYVLHTVAELFLSPTGLSYVGRAAPKRHASLLMGVWFISSFLAHTIGGKLAGEADPEKIAQARFFFQRWGLDFGTGYANFFFQFVFVTIAGGIVIMLLTPLFRKLMRNPND